METIAVVGCGHWGRNLVRNFAGLAVIRATWDSDRLSWPRSRKNFQVSPLPILPRGLEGRRDSGANHLCNLGNVITRESFLYSPLLPTTVRMK